MRTFIYSLFFGLLSVGLAVSALRICPSCAYEAAPHDAVCTHCGKALPLLEGEGVAAGDAGDLAGMERTTKSATVSSEEVIEEGRLAVKYLKDGNADLALLFARNAAALEILAEPVDGTALSLRVAKLVEECKAAARTLSRRCRTCEGTGQVQRQSGLSGDGATEREFVRWQNCASCDGRGYEEVAGTVAEQMQSRGKALRSFAVLERGRKYVNVGNAWLPSSVAEALNVTQTAAVLSATASPCEECQGFGQLDCEDCSGTGVERCGGKKCVKGRVTTEREWELSKEKFRVNERCPVCSGRGFISCEKCGGRGKLICDECQGRGERALCNRCNGQGTAPCTRCNGSGTYKGATCPTCGGERVSLCRTCGGDGRKR